ncbi:MAG TPA: NAD-dependent succinate-semialdehyde dehydrogenase [Patescibacteria group bacterium]|nr:NAD-dependent succinate-semialdehyde dehydrogenase [Patescibacteria group bacterium]
MQISADIAKCIERAKPAARRIFSVYTPIDGSAIAEVPDCGREEAQSAAERASAAFSTWKRTTAYERSAILRRWFELIGEHKAALARLMAMEMGKPLTEAEGEVRYAASFVEWYAEEAKRIYGETIPSQFPGKRILVLRQPAGLVFAITPWNFPCAMVTRKVAPALAAACAVILKPAEQAPLSALYLAALWSEAGGPLGTFEVLPAHDPAPVSEVLLDDPRVRVLAFTGSTAVGMHLYERCSPTMKRLGLELGGHAPFLIFSDADLDAALPQVVACKFRNAGQTCVCTNRIYVHERIAGDFGERLKAAVSSLRVGNPLEPETQIGPLVDAQGMAKVQAHVDDAVQKGARLLTGGKPAGGLYFQPTVLTGIDSGMLLMREETFGPVAPVMTFRDEEDGIRQANATSYGLAAYLWTRDLGRAFRVAESLEYGIVGVNDGMPSTPQAPFGGVKYSGIGREGGHWGVDEFLDIKYVSIALP